MTDHQVVMPKLGLTMTEATLAEWHKQDGEYVEKGEPLFTIETAKVTLEIEAPASGVLRSLVAAGETAGGREIYITQDEIDNVITAKAAIFAAAKIVLDRLKLGFSDVKKLYLAGGFGSYVNRENAVKIGLLPDLPIADIHYAGNTSIWGAKLAAFSHQAHEELVEIRKKTTYYDLMGTEDYVEPFKRAMFLPHTDIELFPVASVLKDD